MGSLVGTAQCAHPGWSRVSVSCFHTAQNYPGESKTVLPALVGFSGTIFRVLLQELGRKLCCKGKRVPHGACPSAHPSPQPPSLCASFRDSFRVFQKLSEIFSDENNYSLSRELLIKVRRPAGWGRGDRGGQGVISSLKAVGQLPVLSRPDRRRGMTLFLGRWQAFGGTVGLW